MKTSNYTVLWQTPTQFLAFGNNLIVTIRLFCYRLPWRDQITYFVRLGNSKARIYFYPCSYVRLLLKTRCAQQEFANGSNCIYYLFYQFYFTRTQHIMNYRLRSIISTDLSTFVLHLPRDSYHKGWTAEILLSWNLSNGKYIFLDVEQ